MEKLVTDPLLISHLKEHADHYNTLCKEFALHHGALPRELMADWMVEGMEPFVKKIADTLPRVEAIDAIITALFQEVLNVLKQREHRPQRALFFRLWLAAADCAPLLQAQPGPVLRTLTRAVSTMIRWKDKLAVYWIMSMEKTLKHCQTLDDLRTCGRVLAWYRGAAHLRQRVQQEIDQVSPPLKEALLKQLPYAQNVPLAKLLSHPWLGFGAHQSVGRVGGFMAFHTVGFYKPPVVACCQGHIIASDGRQSIGVFADRLGTILLPGIAIAPAEVVQQANDQAWQGSRYQAVVDVADITSAAYAHHTLAVTTATSHFIFLYAWQEGNNG